MISTKLFQHYKTLLTAILFAIAPAVFAETSLERGMEMRALLSDLIRGSGQAGSTQAASIRSVFATHPKVLQWVAQGEDFEALLKDANLGGVRPSVATDKEIAKQVQVLAQSHADKLLKQAGFRDEVRNALKDRLARLSPADIPQELRNDPELRSLAQDQSKAAAKYFGHLTPEERLKTLQLIPDDAFKVMAKEVNQSIETTKISESEAIRELTSKNAFSLNEDLLNAQEMSDYLNKYFDKLPLENRREMFIAFLKLSPDASKEKQLAAVLNETGPAMQKLLQLIGESAKSPTLEAVLNELKENVKQVPFEQIRSAIEKSLGGTIESKFKSFNPNPLAAGTIGQTYLATLPDGREVVVKVRRPGIQKELIEEMNHLRTIAQGTPLEKLVDQLEENLMRETDFRIEAKNLLFAKQAYTDAKKGLFVAGLVDDFPIMEDLLIQERADGRSIVSLKKGLANKNSKSAFTKRRLAWMRDITESVYEKWIDNAVFGSGHFAVPEGFFHGDLHGGNYFVKRVRGASPDASVLANFFSSVKGPNYKTTLIDLGNAGTLTIEQRRAFLHLGMAAATGSQEEMVEALGRVAILTSEQKAKILEALQITEWKELSASERITLALKDGALKADAKFPRDFLGFKRGQKFLEVAAKEVNELLDQFDPGNSIRRADLNNIMIKVSGKRLGMEIPAQLVSSKIREHTVLPATDAVRLSYRLAREKIDAYFSGIRGCGAKKLKSTIKP
ncbi:MAG TPA: hypothetical protein DCS07_08630 [Bdellovibrionales bacterium]|nr:MAG: hypothetical protein A2Z97_03020 [Bdellovibrionales bacterium GWB1_52_6]OFZ03438.1 MAG: hypothetical protein A2X97_05685 [Bdellovibrionales bacterium GWA1_52_35]OFZ41605.1 MAG: hypothetical protein A2070_04215 [Bdellovibrionales bacterium GWC1_52_8]HAR42675.1 hypothetical protein [Bdellovibrionales bacterium]HCM41019.1 hypothetical protein [Bdellovibrionales bacterium]